MVVFLSVAMIEQCVPTRILTVTVASAIRVPLSGLCTVRKVCRPRPKFEAMLLEHT